MFNEETVEVLGRLYDLFEKQEVSLDDVCNHSVISSIGDIVGTLKFVKMLVELERCSFSLWISFQSSRCLFGLNRQATYHISSLEQMLPYLAAAGHDKHTAAIRKRLQDIRNLCLCLKKCQGGLINITHNNVA